MAFPDIVQDIINIWAEISRKVSLTRIINTSYPLAGGGDLAGDRNLLITPSTAANEVLKTRQANTPPGWGKVDMGADVSGVLSIANGGTGSNTAAGALRNLLGSGGGGGGVSIPNINERRAVGALIPIGPTIYGQRDASSPGPANDPRGYNNPAFDWVPFGSNQDPNSDGYDGRFIKDSPVLIPVLPPGSWLCVSRCDAKDDQWGNTENYWIMQNLYSGARFINELVHSEAHWSGGWEKLRGNPGISGFIWRLW